MKYPVKVKSAVIMAVVILIIGCSLLFSDMSYVNVWRTRGHITMKQVEKNQVTAVGIYTEIHQMANTKIVAVDGNIWGRVEITLERCVLLKKAVQNCTEINEVDKQILNSILTYWEEGDYSYSVEAHNYAWKKLGGNRGFANGLK